LDCGVFIPNVGEGRGARRSNETPLSFNSEDWEALSGVRLCCRSGVVIVVDLRLMPAAPRLTALPPSPASGVIAFCCLEESTALLGTRRGCLSGVSGTCAVGAAVERNMLPSTSSAGIVCGCIVKKVLCGSTKGSGLKGD